MRKCLSEEVIKDLAGNTHAIQTLDQEWEQLMIDRERLRGIFPTGDAKIVLPCNLNRLIWNAQKIFRINMRKPTDLHPVKVISGGYKREIKSIDVGGCRSFKSLVISCPSF